MAASSPEAAGTSKEPKPGASASPSERSEVSASVPVEERRRPRSVLDAIFDEHIADLARLAWGEEIFQLLTEEEIAAREKAAREERARRVRSMRRSRMATEVIGEEGSYVVR